MSQVDTWPQVDTWLFFIHDGGGSVVLQSDGKIVVAGESINSSGNGDLPVWRFENLYQITSLDSSLDTVNSSDENIELGTSYGNYGSTVTYLEKGGLTLASTAVDLTDDRNWSTVAADVSVADYKSYVSGLASAPGAGSSFTLYVPRRAGDNVLGLCPQASSLSQVSSSCSGLSYYTAASTGVSVEARGGQSYWTIANQTGTGGFSLEDTTPPSGLTLSSPSGFTNNNNRPTLIFTKASDSLTGVSSYSVSLDQGKNRKIHTRRVI